MRFHRAVAALPAFLLLVVGPADGRRFEGLAHAVALAVRSCPQLTIFDYVTSRVEDGVVVLDGKVTTRSKKAEIERRVTSLDGVGGVRSAIGVLPPSRADDDLRYRVSRAIYGNPTFWSYAAMPHPPIHIIVEDGRVTLLGVVPSHAERALARSLATGHGERSLANELRTAPR
jgi:hyperosmotically inducible periplasmic protein